jgi:hypothetical protein
MLDAFCDKRGLHYRPPIIVGFVVNQGRKTERGFRMTKAALVMSAVIFPPLFCRAFESYSSIVRIKLQQLTFI